MDNKMYNMYTLDNKYTKLVEGVDNGTILYSELDMKMQTENKKRNEKNTGQGEREGESDVNVFFVNSMNER